MGIKVCKVSAFSQHSSEKYYRKAQKVLDNPLTAWYKGYVEWLRISTMKNIFDPREEAESVVFVRGISVGLMFGIALMMIVLPAIL